MSLDIEKLKKATQELQARMARGSGPSLRFFKPKDGNNLIRVLPAWTTEGNFAGQFWRDVYQHWNVSENAGPVLCPKKTPYASEDKECPICVFVDQMRERKSDPDAQSLVQDLRAKVAYFMSVVDMKDATYTAKDVADFKKEKPDQECPFEVGEVKIQCYAATSTIAEAIMNIVLANEMDITDLDKGYNIIIAKQGNSDKRKTRYTVTPELKATKAPVTAATQLPDLSKIGQVKDPSALLKLLAEGRAGSHLPATAALISGDYMNDNESTPDWESSQAASSDGDDLAAEMRRQLKV